MTRNFRYLILAALSTGAATVIAIMTAALTWGNDGPLSPLLHVFAPIATTLGWIAGGLFVLCVLIGVGTFVFRSPRSRF